MANIAIIAGDITLAETDAIVNAANPIMLGGGGVDGAIHRAAGSELLEECYKVESVNGIRCPTGEARVTGAGKLRAKYVIHTVGPRYRFEKKPEELLASAYTACLDLALEKGCKSIAFPAISCGVYGYPLREAAHIAIKCCLADRYSGLDIYFYLFEQGAHVIWQDTLQRMQSGDDK
ncbi:macro domain-containing protein [Teredinibacter sp. KSP-S5-2]|uniref:macro domain-containing protein n=1 Tax=Teredinibacter sp. KSP-S5-2 TaxID=3034506 RepID=UPI0029343FC9|nr:macro domain-containing protein [Teredinibacter sp. KSP-S5-2]WNO10135.1 macro domain-containing protein [Teredinibacter sp. KSP-S5-2]